MSATNATLTALSLGAGVQSTTLLLMAAAGEFEQVPDVAIFADTNAEPAAVYRHLDWLESVSSIPIVRVSGGDIRADLLAFARRERTWSYQPPIFIRRTDGKQGQLNRQCTNGYKIRPIERELRRRVGRRGTAEVWIGISFDEVERMKANPKPWISNRWPLIERRMTRATCEAWLTAHGYPIPPKSACTFCPFHRDRDWRRLRDTDPESWADAVAVDAAIRGLPVFKGRGGTEVYLHRSLLPLPLVDLSTPQDHGQLELPLNEECAGVCWT